MHKPFSGFIEKTILEAISTITMVSENTNLAETRFAFFLILLLSFPFFHYTANGNNLQLVSARAPKDEWQ